MKYSTGSTDTQEACEVFKDIIIILSNSGICIHIIVNPSLSPYINACVLTRIFSVSLSDTRFNGFLKALVAQSKNLVLVAPCVFLLNRSSSWIEFTCRK